MKRGFSLIELIIVVAILGIVAAIVVPQFQSHTAQARESAAKKNLRVLRTAINLYAAHHGDIPPGYPDDNPAVVPNAGTFYNQLIIEGDYLLAMPKNPFNEDFAVQVLADFGTFPATADGTSGWIYQPATRIIKLNWPGTDSQGQSYFDY